MWRVSTLGTVMLVGMLFSTLPVSSLFFFNDNRSLGDESEARGRLRQQEPESGKHQAASAADFGSTVCASGILVDSVMGDAGDNGGGQICMMVELVAGVAGVKDEDSPAASREALHKPRLFGLSQAHIPLILCCSDIIYGLASGCTIKCANFGCSTPPANTACSNDTPKSTVRCQPMWSTRPCARVQVFPHILCQGGQAQPGSCEHPHGRPAARHRRLCNPRPAAVCLRGYDALSHLAMQSVASNIVHIRSDIIRRV